MSSVEASRADYDCLNALEVGALICSPEDLVIRFANGRAESWFGAELEGQFAQFDDYLLSLVSIPA